MPTTPHDTARVSSLKLWRPTWNMPAREAYQSRASLLAHHTRVTRTVTVTLLRSRISTWLALSQTEKRFHMPENFSEQHISLRAIIFRHKNLLAGISRRENAPERTLERTSRCAPQKNPGSGYLFSSKSAIRHRRLLPTISPHHSRSGAGSWHEKKNPQCGTQADMSSANM